MVHFHFVLHQIIFPSLCRHSFDQKMCAGVQLDARAINFVYVFTHLLDSICMLIRYSTLFSYRFPFVNNIQLLKIIAFRVIIAHSSYLHLPLCRFLIDWRQLDRIKSSSKRVCDKFLNKIRRQYLIRRKLICPLDTLDIILCVLRLAWFAKGREKNERQRNNDGDNDWCSKRNSAFRSSMCFWLIKR